MWIAVTEVRNWTLSLLRASRLMPHYAPIVKGLTVSITCSCIERLISQPIKIFCVLKLGT